MKLKNFAFSICIIFALISCGGGEKKETKSDEKTTEDSDKSKSSDKENSEKSDETDKAESNSDKAVVIAKSGLSLRSKPTGKSKLVSLLPTNAIVKIIETGEEATINGKTAPWYKVQYGEKEGFAFGGYLKKGDKIKATSDASAQTEGGGTTKTDYSDVLQKGLITAKSGLTLREEPNAKSKSITVIPKNEEVGVLEFLEQSEEIEGVYGAWCKVRHGKKEGYLFSAYINLSTATISAKSGLTLREEPSKQGKKITVIPSGKEVYLLPPTDWNAEFPDNVITDEEGGTWYRVRYGKNEGWAYGEFLAIEQGC